MSAPRDHRDLLKAAVIKISELEARLAVAGPSRREPIAVVGIGCRFPGSVSSPDQFWDLLQSGRDAVTEVPPSRWPVDAHYDPQPGTPGKMYTRRAGFIDAVDEFDPQFFSIAPREAAGMDPQQRLLLETSWEALERAGLSSSRLAGSNTGVFVGICGSDYSMLQIGTGNPAAIDTYFGSGVAHSIASGRLSYALGLHGPSLSVDTACSSSALAIHLACLSLRTGECDAALAGGVNVILTPIGMITASQGRMLSPDGKCKTFDASADGYVRAEGCAVIVLKRLSDATRDRDNVLGVILGSAVNQDGRSNGLTAPNPQAQEAVIKAALADAGVGAEDVGYVETHGTGTSLGDPIEMKALAAVFGRSHTEQRPLLVGSVKTNVGHLEAAAGIVGLVKVLLTLQHGTIPPHLHLTTKNPYIPWAELPIDVPTTSTSWTARGSRRVAGLSSFGFSGTNVHLIVAEAPPTADAGAVTTDASLYVLPLSAKTGAALRDLCGRTADWLDHVPDAAVAASCAAAACNRTHLVDRVVITGGSPDEVRASMRLAARGESGPGVIRGTFPDDQNQQVAFLYTGQGSQYHGMGRALFEREPEFRRAMTAAADLLENALDVPLLEVLYGDTPEHNALIDTTAYAQPALFALEHALTMLYAAWGVRPGAVAGHSVGEYAAACAAGVISFEEGLLLIAERGRLMQSQPAGGVMAAVFAEEDAVANAIEPWAGTVSIAACNGPRNIVVSGRGDHVTAVLRKLAEEGIQSRPLTVSHAFHSSLLEPVLAPFRAAAGRVTFKVPTVDIVSNLTGELASDTAMGNPDYWTQHLRRPVQFERTIRTLRELGYRRFVEIGPSPTLSSMGARILEDESIVWAAPMRPQGDNVEQVRRAYAQLYVSGVDVDWTGFVPAAARGGAAQAASAMPTYPFQRKRYWVTLPAPVTLASAAAVHPLLGVPVRSPRLTDKVFQAELTPESPGYLADHRIFDRVIVPAAAYLEMAAAAAVQAFGAGPHVVTDLAVQEAMILPEGRALTVQTILSGTEPNAGLVEIFSEDPDAAGTWRLHASSTIRNGQAAAALSWTAVQDVDPTRESTVDGETYYARLNQAGVAYGATFRAIAQAVRCDGAARATLTIPTAVANASGSHHLHPAILDSSLQTLGLAFAASADDSVYLPMGVEQFVVSGTSSDRLLCRASLRGDGSGEMVIGDLVLENEDGSEVARLGGIRFKRARASRIGSVDDARRLLYEIAWRDLPANGTEGDLTGQDWVVVATKDAFTEGIEAAMRRRGATVAFSTPGGPFGPRGDGTSLNVLYACDANPASGESAEDARARSVELLALTQAIVKMASPATLTVVTDRAQAVKPAEMTAPAQAAVLGLARVVAAEYPTLTCRLIDVDRSEAPSDLVVEALLLPTGEREVAVRAGKFHVPRLIPAAGTVDVVSDQPYTLEIQTRGVLEGLELRPGAIEQPRPGEVQLRVFATGLNFRDVLNAMGMYPGDAGALGSECVGEVTSIGEGVTGVAIGDRVMAMTSRGFSTYAITKPSVMAPLPRGTSIEDAATIPVVFLTAAYALHNLGQIKRGERVLIHAAAGGVGLAAVQIARRAGAEIFVTAGSPEKRQYLRDLGIAHVMDSRSTAFADEIMAATGGEGVDIVLNSLTGEAIPRSLQVLRAGGRFLEIGKTELWDAERLAAIAPGVSYHVLYLGDECERTPDSIRSMLDDLVRAFEAGELHPLPARVFPIEQVEQAFRFMAQAKHIGKVVVSQRRPALAIRPDAAYLVTGGTSGLGLKTAEWLAARGAGEVVLVGRRAPAGRAADTIEKLRADGRNITVVQADVSRREEVERILAAIDTGNRPLAGVIHAAGVVDDALIPQQSAARFDTVFAPKVDGAWHLHNTTRHSTLDFFVLYSAGAALFGSPGQGPYAAANAYLDALANRRQALGLPAASINWGPWADVGMAARMGSREQGRWAAQGLRLIQPSQGIAAVEATLARSGAHVAVLSVDWGTFLAEGGAQLSLLRELAATAPAARSRHDGSPNIVAIIEAADPLDRLDLLRAHVREQVQKVLAVDADVITNTRGLMELGMDSLMSVELSNRLKASLGRSLPTTLAFEHPTVAALTAHLADLLGVHSPTTVAAPAAAVRDNSVAREVAELTEEEAALSLAAELEQAGY